MARYSNDDSGIKITCPLINSVISDIECISVEQWNEIEIDRDDIIETLEQIRTANAGLRDWGSDKGIDIHNLEVDCDDALNEIKDLKDKIKDLEDELREIEEERDDALNEIEELKDKLVEIFK